MESAERFRKRETGHYAHPNIIHILACRQYPSLLFFFLWDNATGYAWKLRLFHPNRLFLSLVLRQKSFTTRCFSLTRPAIWRGGSSFPLSLISTNRSSISSLAARVSSTMPSVFPPRSPQGDDPFRHRALGDLRVPEGGQRAARIASLGGGIPFGKTELVRSVSSPLVPPKGTSGRSPRSPRVRRRRSGSSLL